MLFHLLDFEMAHLGAIFDSYCLEHNTNQLLLDFFFG